MKTFLFLLLTCCLNLGFAQQIQKSPIYPNNPGNGNYLWIEPLSGQIDAVMFLLPGYGQTPENIFTESKLPYVACGNNILTVAAAGGMTMFVDEVLRNHLNLVIKRILQQHPETANKPWIMGGMSAGGTISLRYIEYCQEDKANCLVNFVGVFAADSPIDLIGFWEYCEREIAKSFSQIGVQEAKMVMSHFSQQVGTPSEQMTRYSELSPFNVKAPLDKGNERWLRDIAVRVYHDVDISWQLENRRRSAYEANFLPASEMINRLRLLGNERAEFVQATGRGYRSNGQRHPHSWSIVDEVECVQWIKSLYETNNADGD